MLGADCKITGLHTKHLQRATVPVGGVLQVHFRFGSAWPPTNLIIDAVGLTTPKNAIYTEHRDFSSCLEERPDYVVIHLDNRFPWEAAALKSPEYERLPVTFGRVGLLRRKASSELLKVAKNNVSESSATN